MRRIVTIAAVLAVLAGAGCGGDDESTNGKAAEPATTTKPRAGQQSPTAPKSATTPSTGAPDSGISTRPGGPGQTSGY